MVLFWHSSVHGDNSSKRKMKVSSPFFCRCLPHPLGRSCPQPVNNKPQLMVLKLIQFSSWCSPAGVTPISVQCQLFPAATEGEENLPLTPVS